MINVKDMPNEMTDDEVETALLQKFGDRYLDDALRIVQSRHMNHADGEVVYEGMCILVALYMNKVQNGLINRDRVLH